MTEEISDSEDWIICNDVGALGSILASQSYHGNSLVTARKVALCDIACARHVAHLLTSEIQLRTIELGEAAADEESPVYPLPIYTQIKPYFDEYGPAPDFLPLPPKDPIENAGYEIAANIAYPEQPGPQVRYIGGQSATLAALTNGSPLTNPENALQVLIVKDIFGNPFRPVTVDPAWLTDTVQSIAASIYQDCAFDRMPILADALEEAGCTNADVLLHCRQPGEHVRGCWVVDLVLGKQ